jgi:hypothetical protein
MRNFLYVVFILTPLLLWGCGSSSSKESASTLPIDSPERIHADFFRDLISNESLDRGFLDRALYAYDELANACPDSIVYYASSVIDGPAIEGIEVDPEMATCKIQYDRGAAFNIRSGSIARSSYFGIHMVDDMVYYKNGYELDFYDLVLDIEGEKFVLNGRVHQPHAYEAPYMTSDEFSIRTSQGVVYRFTDLKRALNNEDSSKTLEYAMSGELQLLNTAQPSHVKFNMPTAWKIQAGNSLPTSGELYIYDIQEPKTYLNLKATTTPEQSLYSAYLPNKIVAQNLTVYWRNILISPTEYQLP